MDKELNEFLFDNSDENQNSTNKFSDDEGCLQPESENFEEQESGLGGNDSPEFFQAENEENSTQESEDRNELSNFDKDMQNSEDDVQHNMEDSDNLDNTRVSDLENGQVFSEINFKLDGIMQQVDKSMVEIREIRKLYHNEFSTTLTELKSKVKRYEEIENKRIYEGLLHSIAELYSENIDIVNQIDNEKIQKRLKYMFLDILEILQEYDVQKQESKPGEKRNTRYCKVVNKVLTDEIEKHDTVIKSNCVGFYIGNRPLISEKIDVYIYSQTNVSENDLNTESDNIEPIENEEEFKNE